MKILYVIAGLVMLTSCQSLAPEDLFEPEDRTKSALVEAECAIYFAVETKLVETGRKANGNMSEGCPQSARDIHVDIKALNPPRKTESKFAETLYRRMIARGMPKDIAEEVRKSNAFFDLVQDTDTVYLRR
jgi:hypothetical protein